MPHIFITGASSGIGAALALAYAAPDIRLTLHGRSAEKLAVVASAAAEKGASVSLVTGDVTDAKAMQSCMEAADRAQPLELVIANAGISGGTSGVTTTREQIDAIFATNLDGVLNTIHPAAALMQQRHAGQIAIISSLAGYRGFAGSSAYGASKAAVRIYGEALRADLAPMGIKVNVICPGFIQTPMTDVNPFSMPFLMPPERAARIIQRGLTRNRAVIAFPWQMALLVRLAELAPLDWIIGATRGMRQKPPFDAA